MLTETARAALATDPVCDSCLGRLVADRSYGLTNAERGRTLRQGLALADDKPRTAVEQPDSTTCWVCEDELDRLDWWAEQAATALRGYEFATYQVGTKLPPLLVENDRLLRAEAELAPDAGETMSSELNREIGKRLGELTGATVDFDRPDVLVVCDLATDELDVTVHSAFVYGRYRKLTRGIPQTEWPCNECNGTGRQRDAICPGCDGTGYRYDESVEQLVAPPIQAALDGTDATFHGAGREDVDALMLGTGRPFVVEVDEPRRRRPDTDTEALTAAVNDHAAGTAEVEGLRLATHEMVERVKELAASKTYQAEIRLETPVENTAFDQALATLDGSTIDQQTPQRVSHRRADKIRNRTIYDIDGTVKDTHGTVEIHGEGGLYVKELLHGDQGRTEPSLAGILGTAVEVTALDVLAVEGESEPFARDRFFKMSV
ncbi:MAG: TIGR01213 family protein [halophilic archaeon J07HX5]|jgi:conserved hypothetical protein TIGR01213|nr:MAG: TIGR01213 family protein [halophilic archaeon J07HX5]